MAMDPGDYDPGIAGLTQLGGGLQKGLETLDLQQEVTFDLYARVVLPFDGYVFWLKASNMTTPALQIIVNQNFPNQSPPVPIPALQVTVPGSVHYMTDENQEEDAVFSSNRVVFSAQKPVQDLNYVGPTLVYIASFDGTRFAFSAREMFYQQADLWHYQGNALYSTMDTQVVDDVTDFNPNRLIVSNSLPAWLAMQTYDPAWPVILPFPTVPIFPSFAVPSNMKPPFISVHVDPEGTSALQSVPRLAPNMSHDQLAHDMVTVTCYGMDNDAVMQFMDAVIQYSFDTDVFGIMNMPVPVDDKKTQVELLILAQKKRIVFEVSYHQQAVRAITQQNVETVLVAQFPMDGPPIPIPEPDDMPWITITSNYVAKCGDLINADTKNGQFTLSMPRGATRGCTVTFRDIFNTWSTNNLLVDPGSAGIDQDPDSPAPLPFDVPLYVVLVNNGTTWVINQEEALNTFIP